MDAMAALIDAGLSGLRPTPSQGDAHPSGEPSPVGDARTIPATRLSYGPPTAVETPASGPSHAEPMLLPTISMSPAAHSAEVRAALDMAAASAEAARLHGIIKDLEHDKMVAAIITEHDKVVAASCHRGTSSLFFHERLDVREGLGRMAAGGRQTCHGTVQ
jgi:hypothetical protein